MYQSDTGYKGSGTLGSKAGLKADMGGTKNDGTSQNFAKEGSQLETILSKEFPNEIKEKCMAHGSPFFWIEEKAGAGKKLTYKGGFDAMAEFATANFADDASVQKQNISPLSFFGFCNMFSNPSPGYTVPEPLPSA